MAEKAEQIYKPRKRLVIDNFLGGISWGVGSVIGATVVVTLIGLALAQAKDLPLIGAIAQNIMEEINRE